MREREAELIDEIETNADNPDAWEQDPAPSETDEARGFAYPNTYQRSWSTSP